LKDSFAKTMLLPMSFSRDDALFLANRFRMLPGQLLLRL